MIKVENVSKKFNDQLILSDISLQIADGEKVLFVGQNGAGKSSLMRTILALTATTLLSKGALRYAT